MMYYNYNPHLLYLQKHNIYYYKNGGLIIKGKKGLKDLKKIAGYLEDTRIGRKFAELTKAGSRYSKLLKDYFKELKNYSLEDFFNGERGEHNNINILENNILELTRNSDERVAGIARSMYAEILDKKKFAKACNLVYQDRVSEGKAVFNTISNLDNIKEFVELLQEYSAKGLAARTKTQETTRKGLGVKKEGSEKKDDFNEINFGNGIVIKSNGSKEINFGNGITTGSNGSKDVGKLELIKSNGSKGASKLENAQNLINSLSSSILEQLDKLNEMISSLVTPSQENGLFHELFEKLNKVYEEITKLRGEREETLDTMKKKYSPLAYIKKHPWSTALIGGTALTLGGGAIAGTLYLAAKGIGKINQAGWKLTTGKEADTTTVNQPPVLEQLNNGKTDTIPRKSNISTRIEELYNANQGQ